MQEFKLDKKYIKQIKLCLVVFVAFLALALSLPFLPGNEEGSRNGTLITSALCTLIFGSASFLAWRTQRKLYLVDIAADNEGIWYLHIGKDNGLVKWDEIHRVRERRFKQRLVLQDINYRELLKVEYQLSGFETIRELLNERAGAQNEELDQSSFSKGPLHHLFYLVVVIGIATLGFLIGKEGNALLGFGAMSLLLVFIVLEYTRTATGVKITDESVIVLYPFTKTNIPIADIVDIVLADEFHKGNRMPEVWIVTRNSEKPFKLKQIGADSNFVYKTLKRATKL